MKIYDMCDSDDYDWAYLPATGAQHLVYMYDADQGAPYDDLDKYHYLTPKVPFYYGRRLSEMPLWVYQFGTETKAGSNYLENDDAGLFFKLPLLVVKTLQTDLDTIKTRIKVDAMYKYCAFDWKVKGKSQVYILDPDDKYTWNKLALEPRLRTDSNAIAPETCRLPGSNRLTRVKSPHVNFTWVDFEMRQARSQFPNVSMPVGLFDMDWMPIILTWFRVQVYNTSSTLWEKHAWPKNAHGSYNQEDPYDLGWNDTNLNWDASLDMWHIDVDGDTWKSTTSRDQYMYHQRLSPTRVKIPGYNHSLFSPGAFYIYWFPFGEYMADFFADSDDEEEAMTKQHMVGISLPNSKVRIFEYWFNTIDISNLKLPVPMNKVFDRTVHGSEDWDYSESKPDGTTYLELFLDGMAILFLMITMYVVGKYSKKVIGSMLAKWKWKRKISSITGRLDEILDILQHGLDETYSMVDQLDEIEDNTIITLNAVMSIVTTQQKIADALNLDVDIKGDMLDMFLNPRRVKPFKIEQMREDVESYF